MALDTTARLILSFEMVDKATAQATANLQKIQKEAKTTNAEIKKGFEASSESIKSFQKTTADSGVSVERAVSQASRSLLILGGAITGSLAVAVNHAAKTNYELFSSLRTIRLAGEEFASTVGVAMIPIINSMAEKIKEGVNWFNDLDPAVKKTIVQIVAWTGGVALALGTAGGLAIRIAKIIELVQKLNGVLKITDIGKFFLQNGWVSAVGAMAALIALIDKIKVPEETAKKNLDRIRQSPDVARFLRQQDASERQYLQARGARRADREGPDGAVDIGSISVKTKSGAAEKALSDLHKHASKIADDIANKFKVMTTTYFDSLQGISGVTMTIIQTTIDGVTKGLGDSVAQSLVYGKNFAESMKEALKSLAAQIISFLVSTIAKIAALRALGVVGPISAGALGLGGGAAGGSSSGASTGGGGISGFFKSFLPFANGGTITEPIMGVGLRSGSGYTFGENGPEHITPLTGRSASGGSQNFTFHINGEGKSAQDIAYEVSRIFKRETMRLA